MTVIPYRAPPFPLVAMALLSSLWVFTSTSSSVTQARCDADLQQLLNDIEKNKLYSLEQINNQLKTETDPNNQLQLEAARERAWDHEEQKRAQAGHIWRDCMKAANPT